MDLAPLVKESLPPHLWQILIHCGQLAGARKWRAYLVGGMVRDILLGRKSLDLDIVVEGDALQLAKELAVEGLTLHHRFGTAKLRYGEWSLDLATARCETYPHPGALPVVKPGTISNDLSRRDFTINAMAMHLSPDTLGELLDPFKGKEDVERGLIRILHPNSFIDDATRILRALRYEQRFGFHLEQTTQALLVRDLVMLNTISGDRLRHELELLLKEEYPHKVQQTVELKGKLPFLSQPLPPSQIYNFLKSYSPTAILANNLSAPSPQIAHKLELFLHHLRYVKLSLKGEDLRDLGVPLGPQMGLVFKRLLDAKLDEKIKTRQEEEELVRRWLASGEFSKL